MILKIVSNKTDSSIEFEDLDIHLTHTVDKPEKDENMVKIPFSCVDSTNEKRLKSNREVLFTVRVEHYELPTCPVCGKEKVIFIEKIVESGEIRVKNEENSCITVNSFDNGSYPSTVVQKHMHF